MLVNAILRDGPEALVKAKEFGVTPDILIGNAQIALDFVYKHHREYREVPHYDVVKAKLGFELDRTPSGVEFLIKEVHKQRLFFQIKSGMEKAATALTTGDAHGAYGSLESLIRDVRRTTLVTRPVKSLFDFGDDVLSLYERVASGQRGILTRWPSINEDTLGFWPQDLILIVARQGQGKTFLSLMIARDAWHLPENKKRVLYVTTEVSTVTIANRFYAIHMQLPYKRLRSGKLPKHMYESFKKGVETLRVADNMYVLGSEFDCRFENIEAAIEYVKPDIVVLDGAYLVITEGHNRTERAANVFDELKRLAHRNKIVLIATHQLNRNADTNKKATVTAETIALSDTAGWNSDVILAMIQTPDMKIDKRMLLKPLKVREGESDELELNWDLDAMDFSELPKGQGGSGGGTPGGGGDADEFGLPGKGDNNSDQYPF